jgi:hypothetical protein
LGGKLRWRLPTPAGFAGQTKANIDNMTVNPEKSLINMVVSSFHEIHPNSQAIEIKQVNFIGREPEGQSKKHTKMKVHPENSFVINATCSAVLAIRKST